MIWVALGSPNAAKFCHGVSGTKPAKSSCPGLFMRFRQEMWRVTSLSKLVRPYSFFLPQPRRQAPYKDSVWVLWHHERTRATRRRTPPGDDARPACCVRHSACVRAGEMGFRNTAIQRQRVYGSAAAFVSEFERSSGHKVVLVYGSAGDIWRCHHWRQANDRSACNWDHKGPCAFNSSRRRAKRCWQGRYARSRLSGALCVLQLNKLFPTRGGAAGVLSTGVLKWLNV